MQQAAYILLLVVLVSGVSAGPTGTRARNQCVSYCKEATKFKYDPGQVYVYDYAADTVTSLSGAGAAESRLHVTAQAEVEATSPCEFILTLKDVKLQDSDPTDARYQSIVDGSDEFAQALGRYPLRFAYQDGAVEQLCPSPDEPAWVLNIKRGVLSAFQNTMKDLTKPETVREADVSGNCEAEYSLSSTGYSSVTVKKTKDLLACIDRHTHFNALQSTPYLADSKIQSLPVVRATHECEQTIRNSRLEKSVCTEKHVFRPFSSESAGAVTTVTQTVTYNSEHRSRFTGTDYTPTRASLLYEHGDPSSTSETKERLVRSTLQELETHSQDDVKPQVPHLFARLVYSLRPLSYTQLTKIFNDVQNRRTRKFLIDAMPLVGTSAGMSMMRDLIQAGDVLDLEANIWLSSLAFQKHPTLDMMDAVLPLLDGRPRQKALLGISAMVNSYCKHHSDCGTKSQIRDIIRKFESLLGSGCRARDPEEEKLIIVALKAIGNAGRTVASGDVLRRCYQEKNSMDIRLAAIDAFRRIPCEDTGREHLIGMYTDVGQEAELRMAAYLAVMRCPNSHIIQKVKDTLYSEPVNQVASFVWTHLTNLQESGSRSKQEVKELLANDFLRNKFNTDARKFSRNYEGSLYWREINTGVTAESNIIFSPKSYIPRSAMMNLTLDLFGESINLFEIGGRIEGFEHLVESFFGPSGYFPEETVSNILRSFRKKRDIDQSGINKVSDVFNAEDEFADEPKGSMYLRMFGNEFHYAHFHGLQDLINMKDVMNPLDLLLKLVRQQDIDYTKSFMFLDTSYIIPTIAGLPLNLTVNGTATLGLKVSGKFDVQDVQNIDIKGHIKPSAAVEISGIMAVDAYVAKTGLKLVTNMHTSTFLDGKVEVKHGDIVSVNVNMPKEKMEILDASVQHFLIHREHELEQEGITSDRSELKVCTPENLASILGVEFCGELQYANASRNPEAPYFPLTGPASVKLYLQKTDRFNGYEFQYRWQKEEISHQYIRKAFISLDTPGSRINRRTAVQFTLDEPAKAVHLNLNTPFKSFEVSGNYEYNPVIKSANLAFTMDSRELFSLESSLHTTSSGKNTRYDPILIIRRRGSELMNLKSTINIIEGSKYSVDMNIQNLFQKPVKFTADINRPNNERYEVSSSLKSYLLDSNIDAVFRLKDAFVSSKAKIEYSFYESTHHSLSFTSKLQKSEKGALSKYSAYMIVQPSQFPGYNTELSWDVQLSHGYLENNGKFIFGKTHWDFSQMYSSQGMMGQADVTFKVQLTCPKMGVDYLFSMHHQTTENSLMNRITTHLSKEQQLVTLASYSLAEQPLKYSLDLEVSYPGREAKLKTEVSETKPGEYSGQFSAQWQRGEEMKMVGSYKDLSSSVKLEHLLDLKARVPGLKNLNVKGELSASAQQSRVSSDVEYGSSKYSGFLEYSQADGHHVDGRLILNSVKYTSMVKFRNDDRERSVAVDLKGSRHVELKAVLKPAQQSANFDLYWDKDGDASKHVTFNGRMKADSLHAVLKYPGRVVEADVALGNQVRAEVEWAPNKKMTAIIDTNIKDNDMSGSLTISTPFPGFEFVSMEGSHRISGTSFDSQVSLTWKKQRMSLKVNGLTDQLKGNAHFTSTLEGFEEISLSVSHLSNAHQLQLTAAGSLNKKQMALNANWENNSGWSSSNVIGSVTFTSPFNKLESLAAKMNFEASSGKYKAHGELEWAQQKIEADVSGEKTDSEFTSDVIVNTPFVGYEALTTSVRCKSDGTSFGLKHEAALGTKKVMYELSGSRTVSWNSGATEVKFRLTSPFTNDIIFNLVHTSGEKFRTVAKVQWSPNNVYSLQADGSLQSFGNSEINLSVVFPGYQIASKMKTLIDDQHINIIAEGSWNQDKFSVKLTVSNEDASEGNHIRINGAIFTPLSLLDDIKLALEHKYQDGGCFSYLQLSKKDQAIVFTNSLRKTAPFNWENKLEFRSPFSTLQTATITDKQVFTEGRFKHDFEVNFDDKKASGSVSYISNRNNIEAHCAITSPWKDIKMDFTNIIDGNTFSPALSIEYTPGKVAKLGGKIMAHPLQSVLALNVNIPDVEPLEVKGQYDLSQALKSANVNVKWQRDQQLELNMEGHFSLGSGSYKVILNTPFSGYEKNSIETSFNIMSTDKTVMVSALYGGKKFELSGVAKEVNQKYEGSVHLYTPFQNYKHVTIFADLDMSKPTMAATLSAQKNSDKIQLAGTLMIASDGKMSLTFTSPIKDYESLSISASYSISRIPNTLEVIIQRNNQKMSLVASGSYHKLRSSGTVNLNLPFHGYEVLTASGEYDFYSTKKTANLKLQKSSVVTEIKLEGHGNAAEGNFELSFATPFRVIGRASGQLSYDFTKDISTGTIKMIVDGQKAKIDVYCNTGIMKHKSGLKVETPFEGYRNIELSLDHDLTKREKSVSIIYKKDGYEGNIAGTIKIHEALIAEGSFEIQRKSPYNTFNPFKVSFKYNAKKADKTAELRINASANKLVLTASGNFADAIGKISGNIIDTFWSGQNIALELDYDLEKQAARFNIDKNGRKYIFTGELKLQGEAILVKITTPFTGYEVLNVAGSYDIASPRKHANLALKRNDDNIALSAEGSITSTNTNIDVSVKTPFSGFETLETHFYLDTSKEDKSALLRFSKNSAKIELHATGAFTGSTGNIHLTLASPVKGWESVTIDSSFDVTSQYKGTFSLERNGNRKTFAAEASLSNTSASIKMRSPIDGFESVSADGKIDDGAASLLLKRNEDEFKLTASGALSDIKGNGKLTLKTPYPYLKSISIFGNYDFTNGYIGTFTFEKNGDQSTFKGEATLSDGSVTAKVTTPFKDYETFAGTVTMQDKSGRFEIKTPFQSYQSLSGEGTLSSDGAAMKLTRNADEFQLSLKGKFDGRKGEGHIILKTPFKDFESTSVEVKYDVSSKYTGSFALEKNNVKSIVSGEAAVSEDSASFSVRTPFNGYESFSGESTFHQGTGDVRINTPISGYETLVAEGSISTNAALLKLRRNNYEIKLDVGTTFDNRKGKGHIFLTTPFSGFESIGIDGSFNTESAYTGTITFVKNNVRNTFSGEATLTDDTARLRINTPYDSLQSISGEGSIKDKSGSFRMDTPIPGYQSISGEGSFAGDSVSLGLKKNEEEIKVTTSWDFTDKNGNGHISVATPFSGWETASVSLAYDIRSAYSASLTMNVNGEKKTFSSTVDIDGKSAKVKVNTPFKGFETFAGDGSLSSDSARLNIETPLQGYESISGEGHIRAKSAAISLRQNNAKFDLSISGSFDNKKGNVQFKVVSPIKEWESIVLVGKYDLTSEYSGTFTFDKNNEKHTISGEASIRDDSVKFNIRTPIQDYESFSGEGRLTHDSAHLSVKTPFTGYEELAVSGRYNDDYNGKKGSLSYEQNGVKRDFSISFTFAENMADIKVDTPFSGFQHLEATVTYNLSGEKKSIGLILIKNNNRYQFGLSGTFRYEEDYGTVELEVTTPFRGYEKISISGNYNFVGDEKSVAFSGVMNEETVSFTGKLDLRQKQVAISVTTPFRGFEHLKFTASLNHHPVQTTASISLQRNEEKSDLSGSLKFDGSSASLSINTPFSGYETMRLSGKYGVGSVHAEINTPLRGYEHMAFTVDYNIGENDKRTKAVLTMNRDKYEVSLSLKLEALKSEVAIAMTTAISGYKNVAFRGKYDFSSERKSASVTFEKNQRTELNIVGTFMYQGLQANVNLQLSSPFPGYENVVIAASYNIPDDLGSIEASLQVGRYQIKISGRHADMSGHLAIQQTVIRQSPNIEITWQFDNTADSKKADVLVNFDSNRKVHIVGSLKFDGLREVQGLFSISSPFTTDQKLGFQWHCHANRFDGKITYNEEELNMDVSVKYSNKFGNLEMKFRSPFQHYEALSLKAKYNFKDKINIGFTAQWDSNSKIDFDAQIKVDDIKGEGKLTFTAPVIQSFLLSTEYDFTTQQKTFNALLKYRTQKVQLAGNMKLDGPAKAEGQMTFTSPFKGLRSIILSGNFNAIDHYEATFNLEKENKKVGLTAMLQVTETSVNSHITFSSPVPGFEKLELLTGYEVNSKAISANVGLLWSHKEIKSRFTWEKGHMKLTFNSPLEHLNNLVFDGKYNLESDEKSGTMTFEWGESSVATSGTYLYTESDARLQIRFSSPFPQLRNIIVSANYKPAPEHNTIVKLQLNERLVELAGKFDFKVEKSHAEMTFVSPLEGATNLAFRAEYEMARPSLSVSATAQWGSKKINFAAAEKVDSQGMKSSVKLTTPFEGYESMSLNTDINLSDSDMVGTVKAEAGTKKIELQCNGRYYAGEGNGQITLSVPFFDIKNMKIITSFNNRMIDISLEYGRRQKLELKSVYEVQDPIYSVNVTLKTPFQVYENLAINTYINTDQLYGMVSVELNQQKQIELSAILRGSDITLFVDSPYTPARNMKFTGSYVFHPAEYGLATVTEWNTERLSLRGKMTNELSNYGFSANAEWADKKADIEATVQNRGIRYIKSVLKIRTPFRSFDNLDLDFTFNSDDQNVNARMVLKTPFREYPSMSAALDLKNNANAMEGSFTATAVGKTMIINGKINYEQLQNIQAQVNIDIPFIEVREVSLVGTLRTADLKNMEVDLRLTTPTSSSKVSGHCTLEDNKLDVAMNIHTPFMKKDVTFGYVYNGVDHTNMDWNVYFNENKLSGSYKLEKSNLRAEVNVNAPSFRLVGIHASAEASFQNLDKIEAAITFNARNIRGKLSAGYDYSDTKISGHAQIETDLLDTRKAVTFYLLLPNYYEKNVKLEASLISETTHLISAGINWSSKIVASGKINSKITGDIEANLDITPTRGTVSIITPNSNHQGSYTLNDKDGYEATLSLSSPVLPTNRLTLTGLFKNPYSGIEVSLTAQTSITSHSISLVFSNGDNLISANLKLQTPLFNINTMSLQGKLACTGTKHDLVVILDAYEHHSISAKLNEWPIEGEVVVQSSFLPFSTLAISGFARNTDYNDMETEINLAAGKERFKLAGRFHRDYETIDGLLTINTPIRDLSMVRMTANCKMSDGISAELNIQTTHHVIPKAGFSAKYKNSGRDIDASLSVETPLEKYKKIGLLVNIPLHGSNIKPRLTVSTPHTDYTFRGVANMLPSKLDLKAVGEWEGKKLDAVAVFNWNKYIEAHIEVNTPFWGYEHYEWDLKGAASLANWARGEASAYVEWNKEKIEFSSRLITEPRTYISIIELNTPFKGYDRYALTLRFQGTERKTIHAQLEYPGQSIGIEFDYYYNNPLDFTSKATINTPFAGYESFSLALINQLTGNSYTGNIEGKWAPYAAAINIEGKVEDNVAQAIIEAVLNDYHFQVKTEGRISPSSAEATFDMNTPFSSVKNINSFIRGEKRGNDYDTGIGASCNGKKIFHISVTLRGDVTTIEVHNPSYPISVSYSIENHSGVKKLKGEVCWDLNKKRESSLGGEIHIKDTSYGRELTVKTISPNRVLSLNINHETTSDKLDHSVAFSWGTDKTLGYKILLEDASGLTETKYNAIVRLNFPIRSFEVESRHTVSRSATMTCLELRWDAARDASKMMGIRIESQDLSSWGKTAHEGKIILQHSALEHDITLHGQFSTAKSHELFSAKTELTYSPIESHKLSISTSITDEASGSSYLYNIAFIVQHPVSNVDLELTSSLKNNPEETGGNIHAIYVDNQGRKKFLELESKIHYTQQQAKIELKSTDNSFVLKGSLKERGEKYIASIESKVNKKEQLTVEGKLNVVRPSVELDINLGRNHDVSVFAGVRSKREVSIKALHKSYGQEVIDGMVNMKLNNSRLLTVNSYWRPTVLSDLKHAIVEYSEDFYYSVLGIKNAAWDVFATESPKNIKPLLHSFRGTLDKLSTYTSHEVRAIKSDFQDVATILRKMYWNNDFFLRDIYDFATNTLGAFGRYMYHIVDGISTVFRAVGEAVSFIAKTLLSIINNTAAFIAEATKEIFQYVGKICTEIKNIVAGYAKFLWETFEYYTSDLKAYYKAIHRFIVKYYGRIEAEVMQLLDEVIGEMAPLFEQYRRVYKAYYNKVAAVVEDCKAGLDRLKEAVLGYYSQLQANLLGLELVQDTLVLYGDYATWLEEFHLQDYLDTWRSWGDSFLSNTLDKYHRLTRYYRSYTDAIYEAARGHYQKVKRLPPVAYLTDVLNRIYQKTAWVWRYFELEDLIRSGLHSVLARVDKWVTDFYSKIEKAGDMDVRQFVLFEPEKGRLEYTQYLPVAWESFEEIPRFGDLSIFNLGDESLLDTIDVNTYYYEFLDAIHNYTPDYNIWAWVPPFGTHALLAGKQHYMTFDKKYFEFAGECSYLLASDFIDSNFSAVVNYEGKDGDVTKKSLTVISDNKIIDIGTNYKVTVDGRKVELPQEYENTIVKREGSKVIVHNRHGINIECNLFHDICTVELSGWYYGKTGGLFGTYDNEPSNDFMTPGREIKDEVDSFAYSWKVGSSRCRIKNYATEASGAADWACQELYESQESPFRPCFSHVNPAPFKRMCVNDLASLKNSPTKDTGICSSGAGYVTECKFAGIDIWQPPVCVRCEMEDGTVMTAGDMKTYEKGQAPSSSDVVFIIDQQPRMKDYNLEDVVDNIEGALQEQGVGNNRYAVVGYGGKGVYEEPHIHTTNNNIWGNKRSVQVTLEGLKFEGKGSNVHPALEYAVNLPFRPGVSKTLVLVIYEDCNDASNYADALTMLIEHDITLHILNPSEIRLRSKRPEDESKILGYDAEAAYTVRNVKKIVGDKDLRRQIRMPKDFCTPLAMETNGTVFNLNKMNPAKRILAKKSVDVFSRRLALTAKPSECQRCECFADRDGRGTVQCQRCVSPSIEDFLKNWQRLSYNEDDFVEVDVQPMKKTVAMRKGRKSRARKIKRE